ncbi:unnamed protein product [Zymoseptoria tritici ST99CH_1A5]|nr:unnamed protein product [Zymoseptoria tritici ST99CH_3D1]SMY24812.1 unnamed protein product [Zymoseptoria tritici ST99CH_1A5]
MARAAKEALQQLHTYVTTTKSRLAKLISGQGEPGQRAAPAQTGKHDAQIGVRLDYGDKFERDGKEYRRFKLQPNKQAANPTLKAMAAENSHQILAEADLQINPPPTDPKQAFNGLIEDLEQDLEEKAK